ncbi:MAG: DUF2459 domain-containing protein [Alphaproteobacteria bacterium]
MSFVRWTLRSVGVLVCLGFVYMIAAWIGAAVSVGEASDSDGASEVFVQSNGIHLEFVVPTPTTGPLATAAGYLPGPQPPFLGFGWGERDFFLKTPTWADFNLAVAAGALLWQSDVLMRVRPVYETPSGPNSRRLRASDAQAAQIKRFIQESIYFGPNGQPVPVESTLYDPAGVFLEGRGTYTPFYTCNEWVNDGLRRAGVRTAAWSPFPHGVMWQLD